MRNILNINSGWTFDKGLAEAPAALPVGELSVLKEMSRKTAAQYSLRKSDCCKVTGKCVRHSLQDIVQIHASRGVPVLLSRWKNSVFSSDMRKAYLY